MEWGAVGKGKEQGEFFGATVLVNATYTVGSAYRRLLHPEASHIDILAGVVIVSVQVEQVHVHVANLQLNTRIQI
jgi:hypothetical protein